MATITTAPRWSRFANQHPSHRWTFDLEDRCWNCDCRAGGLWSAAPCGIGEEDLAAVAASTGVSREDAGDWLGQALAGR